MRNAAIEYKTRCNPLTQEKGALYRSDFVRLSGEEKATDYSILPQLGSGRCRMVLDGIGVVFYKGAERLEALVLEKLAAQIRNLALHLNQLQGEKGSAAGYNSAALPFSYGFQHTRGLIYDVLTTGEIPDGYTSYELTLGLGGIGG